MRLGQCLFILVSFSTSVCLAQHGQWEPVELEYPDSVTFLVTGPSGQAFIGSKSRGLFCSSDNGVNWEHVTNGLPSMPLSHLARAANGDLVLSAADKTFFSRDGLTWSPLTSPWTDTVRALTFDKNNHAFAAVQDRGIYELDSQRSG